MVPITFLDQDLEAVKLPYSDLLVIKLWITNAMVSRVLVDGRCNSYILCWENFPRMGIDKEMIWPVKTSLHAFNGVEVKAPGVIALQVYIADGVLKVKFLVVVTPSAMKVIMGREQIHAVKGVVSTLHQVMRVSVPEQMVTIDIKGDQFQSRKCYNIES